MNDHASRKDDVYRKAEKAATEAEEWSSFFRRVLMGYVFKDLITVLLDQAGYEVYPYGYESFLPSIKRKLYQKEIKGSPVLERVRFMPDIVVYDPAGKLVQLVEVKSRGKAWRGRYEIDGVQQYRRYWPESILALAVPEEPYLCAQRVSQLPSDETHFSPTADFVPIEDVFVRINWKAERPISRSLCVKLATRLFSAFEP